MQDETTVETTTLDSSIENQTEGLETAETETPVVETKTEAPEEPRIPLSRLKEETSKRRELEARLAEMEQRLSSIPTTRSSDNGTDPEIEAALEKLTPLLQQKGFTTRQQLEDEQNAKAYAEEMKSLSKELDGSDGRPAFEPFEVTEWGKQHKVYDLRSAYELMYKKELFDWELKKDKKSAPNVQTEKPSSSGIKSESAPLLTREAIAKKLAAPGGLEWWEKNRDKLMAASARGEIQ